MRMAWFGVIVYRSACSVACRDYDDLAGAPAFLLKLRQRHTTVAVVTTACPPAAWLDNHDNDRVDHHCQ